MKWLWFETLSQDHDRLVLKCKAAECSNELYPVTWDWNASETLDVIACSQPLRCNAMSDRYLA